MDDPFRMLHYTITAPKVRNDGTTADYPQALRAVLLAFGIDGWTEHDTVGVWHGKREPGIVFTVYLTEGLADPTVRLDVLAKLARRAMPDQEAVQVTYHGTLLLAEG